MHVLALHSSFAERGKLLLVTCRNAAPAKSNVGTCPIEAAAYAVVPYSRSLFTPGIGTGYLPSRSGITGAGPLIVNSATPGAIVRAVEHLIVRDLEASVGRHATHARHQAGLDAAALHCKAGRP